MNMEQNNHGSWAKVGDMVECLNPMGEPLGLYGLVQSVEHQPTIHGPKAKRILNIYMNWNDGPSVEPVKDAFVRIRSRA